jgi:hypothetical protein
MDECRVSMRYHAGGSEAPNPQEVAMIALTRSRFRMSMMIALATSAFAAAVSAQDNAGGADAAPETPGSALPDALRNPRSLRNEQLVTQGPRMVAGGMPITSETFLDYYARLEPIIGEFTFTGLQFGRDAEPTEFSGTWTNRWVLDGLYLESQFTLNDRSGNPYQVLGLTWYDDNEHQFRAQFLNSANQSQSIRAGSFDDVPAVGELVAESAEVQGSEVGAIENMESPRPPTLTMYGRNAGQPADTPPVAKFELVVISVNEFRYVGYSRPRNAEGDEWRKSFELTMTRTDPIEVNLGPANTTVD